MPIAPPPPPRSLSTFSIAGGCEVRALAVPPLRGRLGRSLVWTGRLETDGAAERSLPPKAQGKVSGLSPMAARVEKERS